MNDGLSCICGLPPASCVCGLSVPSLGDEALYVNADLIDGCSSGIPAADAVADTMVVCSSEAIPIAPADSSSRSEDFAPAVASSSNDHQPAPADSNNAGNANDPLQASTLAQGRGISQLARSRFGGAHKGCLVSEDRFFKAERQPIDLKAQQLSVFRIEVALGRRRTRTVPSVEDELRELDAEEANVLACFCELELGKDLLLACERGDANASRELIEEDLLSASYVHPDGRTPLGVAAAHGHLQLAAELLERSAVLDCRDGDGRTPFWLACANGHDHMASMLLDVGANVSLLDDMDRSPLTAAVRAGHEGVVCMLLERANSPAANLIAERGTVELHALEVSSKHVNSAEEAGFEEIAQALRRHISGTWFTAFLEHGSPLSSKARGLYTVQIGGDLAEGRGESICLRPEKLAEAENRSLAQTDGASNAAEDEGRSAGASSSGIAGTGEMDEELVRAGLAPDCQKDEVEVALSHAYNQNGYDRYGVPIWHRVPEWLAQLQEPFASPALSESEAKSNGATLPLSALTPQQVAAASGEAPAAGDSTGVGKAGQTAAKGNVVGGKAATSNAAAALVVANEDPVSSSLDVEGGTTEMDGLNTVDAKEPKSSTDPARVMEEKPPDVGHSDGGAAAGGAGGNVHDMSLDVATSHDRFRGDSKNDVANGEGGHSSHLSLSTASRPTRHKCSQGATSGNSSCKTSPHRSPASAAAVLEESGRTSRAAAKRSLSSSTRADVQSPGHSSLSPPSKKSRASHRPNGSPASRSPRGSS
mmetsp:Transcript_63874/g.106210  ORF Transcript_63874/g.106210 Transcript_63874/m.106210 type:complete len:764 (-) Transcript_63874:408-2699(-)